MDDNRRRALVRIAVLTAGATTLAGCASLHSPPINNYATGAKPFKISGQMTVTPADSRARKFTFVWRRENSDNGAVDVVTVRNAAGIAQARVRAGYFGAELVTPDNAVQADNAQILMRRVFNVPLPLRALGDFLGGEDGDARRLGEKMRQLRWNVQEDVRDDLGLPSRFKAEGEQGGVFIVVNRRTQ